MWWPFNPRSRSETLGALFSSAATAAVILLLAAPGRAGAGEEYALIMSADVPVSDMKWEDVQRLFTFKITTWKPGQNVEVMLPADGSSTRQFLLRRVYGATEPLFRRFIIQKRFQGELTSEPRVLGSDAEAVAAVAKTRGSIALVPADTPGIGSVRVLRVNGLLPGAPGYPLSD